MKKFSSFLLVFVMCMSIFVPYASAVNIAVKEVFGDFQYSVSNNSVSITKYTGSDSHVEIPSEIDGYKVETIAKNAFKGNTSLVSVSIPDTVKTIERFVFTHCTSLTSIIIPDSVTYLAPSVFSGCSALESIVTGNGVTEIEEGAFEGLPSLKKVSIGSGVTKMGKKVFCDCPLLENIEVAEDNAVFLDIDGVLYGRDKSLHTVPCGREGNLFVAEGTERIDSYAAYGCRKLTGVIMPKSVELVGSSAFDGCTWLNTMIIPNENATVEEQPGMDDDSKYKYFTESAREASLPEATAIPMTEQAIILLDAYNVRPDPLDVVKATVKLFCSPKNINGFELTIPIDTSFAEVEEDSLICLLEDSTGFKNEYLEDENGAKIVISFDNTTAPITSFPADIFSFKLKANKQGQLAFHENGFISAEGGENIPWIASIEKINTIVPTPTPTATPTPTPTKAPFPTRHPVLGTVPSGTTFTVAEVAQAAEDIVSHYDSYKQLGSEYSIAKAVTVGEYTITDDEWVYMAGYALAGISGSWSASNLSGYTKDTPIAYKKVTKPTREASSSTLPVSVEIDKVVEIAWKTSNYANNNGGVMPASCGSALSGQVSYYSGLLLAARALEYYSKYGRLPSAVDCEYELNYVTTDTDSYEVVATPTPIITNTPTVTETPVSTATAAPYPTKHPSLSEVENGTSFTVDEIAKAAGTVMSHYKAYMNTLMFDTEHLIAKAVPVGEYVITDDAWAYMAGYALNGLRYENYTSSSTVSYKKVYKPRTAANTSYTQVLIHIDKAVEIAYKNSEYASTLGYFPASCTSAFEGYQISYYSGLLLAAYALDYYAENGILPDIVTLYNLKYIPTDNDTNQDGEYIGYTVNGLKYSSMNGEVSVVGYRGTSENVVIPDEIGGLPVTQIVYPGFVGNEEIKSITLGKNVKLVGELVFLDCRMLSSVTLNDGLQRIGNKAFVSCVSLKDIIIPESVNKLDGEVFSTTTTVHAKKGSAAHKNAVEFGIPFEVYPPILTTEDGLIYDVTDNAYVRITGYEGSSAEVTIPDEIDGLPVKVIAQEAFRANTLLKSVTIGENVTEIGDRAFHSCALLESVEFGSRVKTIGNSAFYRCSAIKTVRIPDSVEEIGGGAFSYCFGIVNVVLGSGLKTIGDLGFYGCSELESVKIGESVKTIGDSAFTRCPKLTMFGQDGSYAQQYAKENGIAFITPKPPVLTVNPESEYEINEESGMIEGVGEKTLLKALAENFTNGQNIVVYDSNGEEVTDENALIGTGYTVKLLDNNGNVTDSKIVSVKGDTNGDAKVNSRDIAVLQLYLLERTKLEGAFFNAGDFTSDTSVNSRDIASLQIKFLGL